MGSSDVENEVGAVSEFVRVLRIKRRAVTSYKSVISGNSQTVFSTETRFSAAGRSRKGSKAKPTEKAQSACKSTFLGIFKTTESKSIPSPVGNVHCPKRKAELRKRNVKVKNKAMSSSRSCETTLSRIRRTSWGG